MGSDKDYDPSSTPKLSLFSFPSKLQEPPPGLLTPPVHTPASIPFQWEEAPGKPRPSFMATESKPKPNSARCLELPPRLLCDTKVMNIPSPTTVLEGPGPGSDIDRSLSYSFSSFRVNNKEGLLFGSSRWGSFRKNKRAVVGVNNSDSSAEVREGCGGGGNGGGVKVKITRVRKRSVSFLSLKSHTSSSWTSICESFKQAVPWRRRQEKLRKMES